MRDIGRTFDLVYDTLLVLLALGVVVHLNADPPLIPQSWALHTQLILLGAMGGRLIARCRGRAV